MRTRIIAGLVLAPPFLWCVWQGGAWFFALALGLSLMAQHEYATLLAAGGQRSQPMLGIAWVLAAYAGMWFLGATGLFAAMALVPNLLILKYLSNPDIEGAAVECAWTTYGAIAYSLPLAFLVLLRDMKLGREWLLIALMLVWVQDSAAYFWGMGIGKHKFQPFISPKKTWEGSVLGMLTALAAVWAGVTFGLDMAMSPLTIAGIGLAAVSAQLGDLNESLLKRNMGVKDSGALIPGHGGILDRFDSFTFAAPVMYFVAQAAPI